MQPRVFKRIARLRGATRYEKSRRTWLMGRIRGCSTADAFTRASETRFEILRKRMYLGRMGRLLIATSERQTLRRWRSLLRYAKENLSAYRVLHVGKSNRVLNVLIRFRSRRIKSAARALVARTTRHLCKETTYRTCYAELASQNRALARCERRAAATARFEWKFVDGVREAAGQRWFRARGTIGDSSTRKPITFVRAADLPRKESEEKRSTGECREKSARVYGCDRFTKIRREITTPNHDVRLSRLSFLVARVAHTASCAGTGAPPVLRDGKSTRVCARRKPRDVRACTRGAPCSRRTCTGGRFGARRRDAARRDALRVGALARPVARPPALRPADRRFSAGEFSGSTGG